MIRKTNQGLCERRRNVIRQQVFAEIENAESLALLHARKDIDG
jgi:hypothetical protein